MKTNLYVAVDKLKTVENAENAQPSVIGVFLASNDGMAIRDNLIPLIKIIHVEKDVGIFHVGTVDLSSGVVESCTPREVSHDCYKMPETPTKNEAISDAMQQQMNKAFLNR